jgi:hypothetical protein
MAKLLAVLKWLWAFPLRMFLIAGAVVYFVTRSFTLIFLAALVGYSYQDAAERAAKGEGR